MAKNLKITLHHGIVNRTPAQRATVKTLGLNKIGKTVVREDTPANPWSGETPCVTWSPLRRLTDYGR